MFLKSLSQTLIGGPPLSVAVAGRGQAVSRAPRLRTSGVLPPPARAPHCSLPWLRPLAHLWVANALGNAATHLAGGRPSTTPWTPTEGSLPLAVESFALCLDVCKATPCGHEGGLRWHPCNRTLMRTWQAVFTGMCPFLGSTRTTVLAALSAGLSVSSRHGIHPTCRPAARAAAGAPRSATPCHHSTQSCWAAPARFDMCLLQPATCGGKC